MLAINYCSKCREKLLMLGELPSVVFEQVCEHYIISGECLEFATSRPFEIDDEIYFCGVIKFLEEKKYVISTECSKDFVQVKPCGLDFHREGNFTYWNICFDRYFHE